MGALTIAFDTIVVGALALPWVYLLVHLLFFGGDDDLFHWLEAHDQKYKWSDNQGLVAVAGVILFAMAFTLGSAVSRIAQDFFNDDDLRIPWIFRMTMTEDRIIASVYCEADEHLILQPAALSPSLNSEIKKFKSQKSNCCNNGEAARTDSETPDNVQNNEKSPTFLARRSITTCPGTGKGKAAGAGDAATQQVERPPCPCQYITSGIARYRYQGTYKYAYDKYEEDLKSTARDIFGMEENFLLLKGEDATVRLRLLHDQIMVLRGATFDGFVALSFCLFGWAARAQRGKLSLGSVALTLVPALLLFLAAEAYYHHRLDRNIGDPPYMEFSLLILGGSGAWLLWLRPLLTKDGKEHRWLRWPWGTLSLVFGVLFVAGVLGWWATETFYAQQVVYSYNSQLKADGTSESGK